MKKSNLSVPTARATSPSARHAHQQRLRRACLAILVAVPVLLLGAIPLTPPAWRFAECGLGGLLVLAAAAVCWRQDRNQIHAPVMPGSAKHLRR